MLVNRRYMPSKKTQIGNDDDIKAIIVRVYEQRTGKILWSRTFDYLQATAWSKDHKSLALAGSPFGIVAWRAGKRTKIYSLGFREVQDGFLDVQWSPHARFLSFLNWRSGGWDLHAGELWVIDTRTGKISQLTRNLVGEVSHYSWVGERRIAYRALGPYGSINPQNGQNYPALSSKTFYFTWR